MKAIPSWTSLESSLIGTTLRRLVFAVIATTIWLNAAFAAAVLSLASISLAGAEQARSVPTNSLTFHLKSLGRTPTPEEREIIEAALRLMNRHQVRSDYPLRSVYRDAVKGEWALWFDSRLVDGAFELFLTDKDASYIEVKWQLARERMRYPDRRKIKAGVPKVQK